MISLAAIACCWVSVPEFAIVSKSLVGFRCEVYDQFQRRISNIVPGIKVPRKEIIQDRYYVQYTHVDKIESVFAINWKTNTVANIRVLDAAEKTEKGWRYRCRLLTFSIKGNLLGSQPLYLTVSGNTSNILGVDQAGNSYVAQFDSGSDFFFRHGFWRKVDLLKPDYGKFYYDGVTRPVKEASKLFETVNTFYPQAGLNKGFDFKRAWQEDSQVRSIDGIVIPDSLYGDIGYTRFDANFELGFNRPPLYWYSHAQVWGIYDGKPFGMRLDKYYDIKTVVGLSSGRFVVVGLLRDKPKPPVSGIPTGFYEVEYGGSSAQILSVDGSLIATFHGISHVLGRSVPTEEFLK